MESHVLPILLFVGAAAALAVGLLGVGSLIGPKRNSAVKEMPYESGMDPIHDTRRRFDVRFHVVAIAFLIFDVELLILYPWAVARVNPEGIERSVAAAVAGQDVIAAGGRAALTAEQAVQFSSNMTMIFAEIVVFIVLLALGFVYAWRKGVFEWR